MNVHVQAADASFERSLCNIVPLFFEEVNTTFSAEPGGEADLQIILDYHERENGVYASASLLANGETQSLETAQYESPVAGDAPREEKRKLLKQAASRVLLDVLQKHTGLVQPWGILTGVRPTKLLHERVRRGIPAAQARRELQEHYLISQEKIELMERIVQRQLTAIPDLYRIRDEVSIYIGIPFCPTKCAYCTFPAYDINGRQGSVNGFLTGLHEEMREIGEWLKRNDVKITTIYYGGGTPTSITAEEMDAMYSLMYEVFPNVDDVREITVEAGRPDTITPEKLAVMQKWGVDRISINPQSYIQETLEVIGRHHTVEETIRKFELARECGMDNINMDLIIGLPNEGLPEFEHTLSETANLMPESLTVHTLSFKRASEMTRHRGDQKFKVADREEITAMMRRAVEWTDEYGYIPYYLYRQKNILGNLENVGYALAGMESLYNILIIEEMQSIVGLGCGASSKFVDPATGEITRLANPKEPKAYNDTYKQYTDAKIEVLERLYGSSRRTQNEHTSTLA
ncbi:Coproporphyrinogen dehydrogenase [Paenibacillus curdlanolyticus YK9]|uniref:Coproporphyrinogen dehydrogenase n=1 Tax=Paenibacillus curdlanolyticus YK9 TaxID=717606 RepID=E0IDZ0_9BACL|nr:coproporphyrinogen III oxidase [Paenibacillus curdlanolyticus]EFM09344.1 Coproporphyrinogen dehydrogenase [Paenibacillus curdlanolyticus YK9]